MQSCGTKQSAFRDALSLFWFSSAGLKPPAVAILLLFLAGASGCGRQAPVDLDTTSVEKRSVTTQSEIEQQVVDFCGACHQTPRPESFPKSAWHEEVRRGFDFYFESGRKDLNPPVQADVVRYYHDRAPDSLTFTAPQSTASALEFTVLPAVASRQSRRLSTSFVAPHTDVDGQTAFWVSDMEHGTIRLTGSDGREIWSEESLVKHPAAVRTCDLDQDGRQDLVCTDLGSFLPEDHDRGRLQWIRNWGTEEQDCVTLFSGIGRLADVRVFDFDDDGDEDLAVAEFGWHTTGGIHLLRNDGQKSDGSWNFHVDRIDDLPGTIHLCITDLNQDAKPDIVALISQEHEQIVAFINEGAGYTRQVLYQAPDPSFGSSGISLVDMDHDGDQDILYTNGDTFDSFLVKPYHGITWLEHTDGLQFVAHSIVSMPGVHRALAADFDQDGDLDIAAVSSLPGDSLGEAESKQFHSVVWLEQTEAGQFAYHVIEKGDPIHAAMALTDFDRDGDVDLVVANFIDREDGSPIRLYANSFVNSRVDKTEAANLP